MSLFDFDFYTQFDALREDDDLQALLFEETQGPVDAMRDFFRFKERWYEDFEDEQEREWLLRRYSSILRESGA